MLFTRYSFFFIFFSTWQKQRKISLQFVYFSEGFKKEMHSLAVLVERLKQNAKLHSLKLFMRVLKIYVRGGNEGREGRGRCEDNKVVAKEIKVLRLTWEYLLFPEKRMESAVVEDLRSEQIKLSRLSLAQEDPAVQAFKIMSSDR